MDKSDTTLEDLTPFLLALVHEGVPDVRALISSLPSNDSAVVSDVYNSKLNSVCFLCILDCFPFMLIKLLSQPSIGEREEGTRYEPRTRGDIEIGFESNSSTF